MSYKNIFFLLLILSSSLTCHAASRSLRHALEAFDGEYSGDTHYTAFKGSPYYTTAIAPRSSKAAYTAALTKQLHLYKLSLGGGGGEAAATPTEIEDMKLNAFNGIRDALDQWKSYLEPKEGVDCTLWIASAGNKRTVIGSILGLILEFVPTAIEYYSNAIRTNLQNLEKDVASSGGAPHPILDGDLTFATISARIIAVKGLLPAFLAFKPMGSRSTSRDIYTALAEKLITPRTFSLGDMQFSITWAKQRIDWLEERIQRLSAEILTLRASLATPFIDVALVTDRDALATAGVNIVSGPALAIINQLASAFLAERAKVDGIKTARDSWLAAPHDPSTAAAQGLLDVINPSLT